jgi:hypothetical protein
MIARVLLLSVALGLAGCQNDQQARRAATGGLIGAGGGAAIGALAGGGEGAAVGAVVGGVAGAAIGAATTPSYRATPRYGHRRYRHPRYRPHRW